jgi:hypothetical protein
MTERMWESDYRHDKRSHRHRCHCCARIVQAGERVLMWRVAKGTKLVHLACADKPHPCGTYWDAIKLWAAAK